MEDMAVREFWRNKRVFLTGHTGFKGGWLALWLADMGAEVYGYALEPPTEPAFFTVTELQTRLASNLIADIRDKSSLRQAMKEAQPEIVFHLAAQPLVRYSYEEPVETYEVNIMGTVNLLEAVRQAPGVRAIINVTSDKCYKNREWFWPYREEDTLGGFDPYSSSKACAELITAAYRCSFLEGSSTQLASARAGKVVGGGGLGQRQAHSGFLLRCGCRTAPENPFTTGDTPLAACAGADCGLSEIGRTALLGR